MRLTPLDIREQQFRRVMRGLDPEEVETFLATVATELESIVSEHKELRQRVVELEEKINEYRSMEKALRDTLLTAEKVMGDAKESAQREAALIIREAELAAQRATARLSQDLVDLRQELTDLRRMKDAYMSRVRWLLRSHLDMIEGHAQEFTEIDAGLEGASGPRNRAEIGAAPAPAESSAGPRRPPAPAPEPPPRPGVPPSGREGWRRLEPGALGALPPADDLADVLRPIAPDGSYEEVPAAPLPPAPPSPPPARSGSTEELAQAVRRAERLAAEARAAAERHTAPPPAGAEGGWSMDRFREGLGDGSQS
jgi:cell division initiation protein